MAKSPAFQFYAQDFDMDTATWECDEVGAYLRLLMYEWVNGGLPSEIHLLAKIAREKKRKFEKKWKIISTKFYENGNGFLINKRLEEVRQNQIKYSESRRKNVSARYKEKPTYVESQNLHMNISSSSSSTSNEKDNNIMSDDEFLEKIKKIYFWIDVDKEFAKMDAWFLNNPGRKKTRRFITNWLNKLKQDKPLYPSSYNGKEINATTQRSYDAPDWLKEAIKDGWK